MQNILETARRLLPERTYWNAGTGWLEFPDWPPDLFALTGTLVQLSGCYLHPHYVSHWEGSCFFAEGYVEMVTEVGGRWRQGALTAADERLLRRLWRTLRAARDLDVQSPAALAARRPLKWWDAALTLMAIADEASAGLGFLGSEENRPFADFLGDEFKLLTRLVAGSPTQRRRTALTLYLPWSICYAVPPWEACVQPKTRTTQIGCTLRSLSHNLALLPHFGRFKTSWIMRDTGHAPAGREPEPFNVLLVPFPYRIRGSWFEAAESDGAGKPNFFSLRQGWLGSGRWRVKAAEVASFIDDLIDQAEREVRQVHCVILPELALERSLARQVATALGGRKGLELFISGVLVPPRRGRAARNAVFAKPYPLRGLAIEQSKHHRWRLEKSQIVRYSLGDTLDPRVGWWEQIDVSDRECAFIVFREGASLATLICEDLARLDPVQEVIRSVGPNLVVVLLLDGPQRDWRWSGRYATVLADDPGSTVLTLTCSGMVRRSAQPGDSAPTEVALWREPNEATRELRLPPGAHGLLLTVRVSYEVQRSLDTRADGGNTARLSLSGVREVTVPKPPAWLDSVEGRGGR
jgi:hypothetical protein